MNKQTNNLHVLSLSAYISPKIQESNRENWVEYGEDNNFFQYLIDRYTNSTSNNKQHCTIDLRKRIKCIRCK